MKLGLFIHPRTLRGRLTIWLSLVLGVVLIGFVIAVYLLLGRDFSGQIDSALLRRADQAARIFQIDRSDLDFERFEGARIVLLGSFSSANNFVQFISLDGEVTGVSGLVGGSSLPVDLESLAQLSVGEGRFSTIVLEGERLRLYGAAREEGGELVGYIQVSRSLEQLDSTLGQLRLFSGIGVAIVILVSAGVIWVTTFRSLRPLLHVIETAEGIGTAGDLSRRVEIISSQDEVGSLVTTFNGMLHRLQDSSTELQRAYEHVEESLEAQRRFVADASHELRTPLTTVLSNATLLNEYPDVTEDDRRAAIAQIDQEASRMSRLVHDLLTLARADAGTPLDQEIISVESLVEDVVDQVESMSPAERHFQVEFGKVGTVMGNRDLLRQLLLILLDNAMKYSFDNSNIAILVSAETSDVRIDVADQGIGISADDLPKIFDRFFRADVSRKSGGSGLGLSIAKWIIEQHNGSITVASTVDVGTTFTVLVPSIDIG